MADTSPRTGATIRTVRIGEEVPDFTLRTFEDEEIVLSDLRGKVVVVNFWASWCNPCKDEAAELQEAWEYYQPGGEVVFLGVDWTDTDAEAAEYLEMFQITYPNGPDYGTRISQEFRITGVPETYIIDRDGILAKAIRTMSQEPSRKVCTATLALCSIAARRSIASNNDVCQRDGHAHTCGVVMQNGLT